MSGHPTLLALRDELHEELVRRILPYWSGVAADERHGGLVGLITDGGERHLDAPKGSIVHARALWTFAATARVCRDPAAREAADRAAAFYRSRFVDPEVGGVVWMVEADGAPRDTRKHVYAQAFGIYALAEHHRATGDAGSLQEAVTLFHLVERHAHDAVHGGYREAFGRDWTPLADVRLGESDPDEPRSMNTHLHLLEAYTGLHRVWPDPLLERRLRELVELFLTTIVDRETGHVVPFFDERWTRRSDHVSYGHDIETSWLLVEAAGALGDAALAERVRPVAVRIAEAVRAEGLDAAGGLFERGGPDGVADADKEWWPQAEAIVGFVTAWELTGREELLDAAWRTWTFVKAHVLDREHGEWHRRVARDGTVRPGHEKVGPWKCPYHNGRACLELVARVHAPAASAPAA